MEELIQWLDDQIMYIKEAIEKGSATRRVITIWEYDHKNLLLVKKYITDYEKLIKDYEKIVKDFEKLTKDYHDVVSQNRLLKLEKMELEGRHIYEDMRMKYCANRRKWGARYV